MKKYLCLILILCSAGFGRDAIAVDRNPTLPGGAIPIPVVFCGSYPCSRTNADGDCILCDCSSVTCPEGKVTNSACGCVTSGSGSGSGGGGTSLETCLKGKYYTSSQCLPCPSGGTTTGVLKIPAITKCYIPAGQEVTDDIGTYEFTTDCYYTK